MVCFFADLCLNYRALTVEDLQLTTHLEKVNRKLESRVAC